MSNIEWTDTRWNPVVGCTPVSPGCLNCYAATMARRLEGMGKAEYQPRDATTDEIAARHAKGVRSAPSIDKTVRIAEVRGGRAVFTGEVRTVPDRLEAPLHWKKPRRVFVNSMSDLFHGSIYGQDDARRESGKFEAAGFEFLMEIWRVMRNTPRHTYQILTKRPHIMADLVWRVMAKLNIKEPLPNVWLGTSVEDQVRADERIPHLIRCEAAVRFLSCEPLLGALDLTAAMPVPLYHCSECGNEKRSPDCEPCGTFDNPVSNALRAVDWVIAGGESGPNFRPCHAGWVRGIKKQCEIAGVPVFIKQMGPWPAIDQLPAGDIPHACCMDVDGADVAVNRGDGETRVLDPRHSSFWRVATPGAFVLQHRRMKDRKGGDPAEWPEDLRVREWPANTQKAGA